MYDVLTRVKGAFRTEKLKVKVTFSLCKKKNFSVRNDPKYMYRDIQYRDMAYASRIKTKKWILDFQFLLGFWFWREKEHIPYISLILVW